MKICAISDLHGYLPEIKECDLLTICGDVVPLSVQRNYIKSEDWIYNVFSNWVKNLPCDKVILIAGNHDFYFDNCPLIKVNLLEWTKGKCLYLENELYKYLDYKIYGTPYTHLFGNWAFMYEDDKLIEFYKSIPNDIDILLTHDTPAIANLDELPPSRWSSVPIHAGNNPLAEAIKEKKPRYVFCGHLHQCTDKYAKVDNTKIYNVSLLDNQYNITYKPLYLDI